MHYTTKKGPSCANRTTLRNQHCHPSPPSWPVLNPKPHHVPWWDSSFVPVFLAGHKTNPSFGRGGRSFPSHGEVCFRVS